MIVGEIPNLPKAQGSTLKTSLGGAVLAVGVATEDREWIIRSVGIFEQALEAVVSERQMIFEAASARLGLAIAYAALIESDDIGSGEFELAAAQIVELRKVYIPELSPFEWVGLTMFADRTSTARMHANQVRLYFASLAYVLMQTLRRVGLAGTELAKAQCGTIRDKVLKAGAQVRVSARRVWLSFADTWRAALFWTVLANLRTMPLRC